MGKWTVLFLMTFACQLHANTPYLKEHEAGWYWHNEPPAVEKKKTKAVKKPASKPSVPADPDKTWKLIGKMAERARAKAILNPTPNNVAEARRIQRMIVNQASLFSERWMLDLLLHPEMDESLVNPSNSAARDVYNQRNDMIKEQAIYAIGQTSGLLYFYEGGEPYSERMAEVVRDFSNRYQMLVTAISVNDRISPLFPQSRTDSNLARQMGVRHIPAVFAMNPLSKKVMPIAYGLVSQSELKENILMASNAFKSGEDHAN